MLAKAEINSAIPCLRCGECCSRYRVRLDAVEAHRLADELGLTREEFWSRYADRQWSTERSLLLRQESWGCPFLEWHTVGGGKQASCRIHAFRPIACREWMPSLYRRECRSGIAKRWGITVNASGELEGPDDKIKEFLSYLDLLASDRRN